MAQEKLIVKNFGPIKDAEIELGKVTVFIGEQASGKSVLAKLVAIFQSIAFLGKSFFDEANIFSVGENSEKDLKDFFSTYNIDQYIEENTYFNYISNIYSIKYANSNFEFQQGEIVDQKYKEVSNTKYLKQISKEDAIIAIIVVLAIGYLLTKNNDTIQRDVTEEELQEKENALKKLYILTEAMHAIYFPAERQLISILSESLFSLINTGVTIPKFITNFGSLFEEARNDWEDIDFNFRDLKYFYENKTDIISYKGIRTKLSKSSSGLQSLLPLLLVIKHNNKTKELKKNYVIEEPELNLYPTYQKLLVNFLVNECTKDGDHLILTTHSPYILSSLDNLIQAGNIVKKHPELKEEVEKIIPSQYHLNYEDVKVYFVADGTARLIMNEEYQGIDVNELDKVSENLNEEFEKLLDLKYQD